MAHTALRAKTFEAWVLANLKDELSDIAGHGADAGWPGITYTTDCVRLFDRYGDEIWEMAAQDADDMGHKNVAEMIAGFNRSDMLGSLDQFKNLMVWYAVEAIARRHDA